MNSIKWTLCLALLLIVPDAASVRAQSDETEGTVASASTAESQKQLASRDPLLRQRAAEDLARLADPANRKLLEGYRLQEKNARVRLALDWALYRIGKSQVLVEIVRALDSQRADQAHAYLTTLESPDPLYLFLERMNGNTQVKLLEVLAKVGDAGTLVKIQAYRESPDPKIAEAVQLASHEIEQRIEQTPPDAPANTSTRPRQVGIPESTP